MREPLEGVAQMTSEFVNRLTRFREELAAGRDDALQAAMDATSKEVREGHLNRAVNVQAQLAVIDEAIRETTDQSPNGRCP